MTDRQLANHIRARESEISAFVERLKRLLDDTLDDIISDIEDGKIQGIEAAATIGSIEDVLQEAGLENELIKIRSLYAEELKEINSVFRNVGVDSAVSAVDKDLIEALIQSDFKQVTSTLASHVADVQSVLMRAVLSPEGADLTSIINLDNEKLAKSIDTELNTATSAFSQTVTNKKAKDLGFNLFEYMGVEDKVTRPFCRQLLNKTPPIYTREEIAGMDNGQDLDVMTYRGGYNCRHQWRPITEERAKELGYTG